MKKLEVSTHSGDTDIVEVEDYDAAEITELRNSDVDAINLGNNSYSRIDIKNIRPVKQEDSK